MITFFVVLILVWVFLRVVTDPDGCAEVGVSIVCAIIVGFFVSSLIGNSLVKTRVEVQVRELAPFVDGEGLYLRMSVVGGNSKVIFNEKMQSNIPEMVGYDSSVSIFELDELETPRLVKTELRDSSVGLLGFYYPATEYVFYVPKGSVGFEYKKIIEEEK